jgi:hypothetical protein
MTEMVRTRIAVVWVRVMYREGGRAVLDEIFDVAVIAIV